MHTFEQSPASLINNRLTQNKLKISIICPHNPSSNKDGCWRSGGKEGECNVSWGRKGGRRCARWISHRWPPRGDPKNYGEYQNIRGLTYDLSGSEMFSPNSSITNETQITPLILRASPEAVLYS